MATVGALAITYADWAKRLDANGRVDKIVEILNQWNEILDDMLVREANDGTGHRTTVRTGIPAAAWRMLNYGVPNAKSQTAQVRDTTGMLETYSEVDKALADMNGNTAQFRLSEANAIMEGMNQQMTQTMFYGNTDVNPERFLGLAPRLNTLSGTVASSANIVDGGGVGSDNTSIWLVVWGENTVHGIFPKGSKAGISHNDLGEQTLFDGNQNKFQGYRDHFKWDLGLTVRDWRFVVRIANIDVSDVTTGNDASLKNIVNLMTDAEERIPMMGMGTPVWYMNRQMRTGLRKGITSKISNQLTTETVAGKRVTTFDGFPVRRVDSILNTEARVT